MGPKILDENFSLVTTIWCYLIHFVDLFCKDWRNIEKTGHFSAFLRHFTLISLLKNIAKLKSQAQLRYPHSYYPIMMSKIIYPIFFSAHIGFHTYKSLLWKLLFSSIFFGSKKGILSSKYVFVIEQHVYVLKIKDNFQPKILVLRDTFRVLLGTNSQCAR